MGTPEVIQNIIETRTLGYALEHANDIIDEVQANHEGSGLYKAMYEVNTSQQQH